MRLKVFTIVAALVASGIAVALPARGEDGFDPYWPGLNSAKLITPQWIGEEGVEAAILLSIDDMRDPKRYEAFCRPILDRLKEIDGRAPLTIFTNTVDPGDPQLQKWLKEGLSIEVHTIDHPCPLLAKGDFAQAKKTVHDCIDLLEGIPGMKPVAYRMPCCDSMNTVSPRFYSEIFSPVTESGNFLQIDSSVFNLMTPDDPELPAELIGEGAGRFAKYVPKLRGFVNYIENYPYPYVIGENIWQLPCVVPSDWEGQDRHGVNNDETVADMKAALDATVLKRGVFTLVFHPHGWIRNDQIVELIDHAVAKHGSKVKFLNTRETLERLNENLLDGTPLRDPETGASTGIVLEDAFQDGFMDVQTPGRLRTWSEDDGWQDSLMVDVSTGLLEPIFGEIAGTKEFTAGTRMIDLDGDGEAELISGHPDALGVLQLKDGKWSKLPISLPHRTSTVTTDGKDAGLRFADVNRDGHLDVIFSNHERYSVHLWVSMQEGWAVSGLAGDRGDFSSEQEIPMIVRGDGSNNGVWFKDGRMFVQNEDTVKENTVVDQRTFKQLAAALTKPEDVVTLEATPAKKALSTMRTHERFEVQLVAAEPLVADPIDLAWGADGKLWVVEMGDYPMGEDGEGKPGGRVRFLEDTNADGTYDSSTLFLEGLAYPSGVMPWKDGVLILAAPNLFFARDVNGDGVCDTRQVLYEGFRTGNPQHLANGLAWGLDNWIYIANGDSGGEIKSLKTGERANISGRDLRVRPETGELDAQSGMTQFSRPRDDWGNWFGCNNSYPLWHYVLHDHYLRRNPHVVAPSPDIKITEPDKHPQIFPASQTIERFNDYHTENRITSACGVGIYRDHALGEDIYGNAFICEPVHNLVYRQVLKPDGYTFSARRANEEQQQEFLASTDNWFRPVTARTGPDGALYVVDMYRHVIEHPEWIPPEWEEKLDLRAGHDKGRIYRVVRRGEAVREVPVLSEMSVADLVKTLESPNGELRDMAHQQLLSRPETSSELADSLRHLAEGGQRPASRLQALAALDGLKKLSNATLRKGLVDPAAAVRRQAVRLCEGRDALLEDLVIMGASEEDEFVLLQLASSLGEFESSAAGQLLASIIVRYGHNHWMQAAAMSSAVPHTETITKVLIAEKPDSLRRILPVLEKMVLLNATVSSEKALPALVKGITASLVEIGPDAFPLAGRIVEAGGGAMAPIVELAEQTAKEEKAAGNARIEAIKFLAAAGQVHQLPLFRSLLTSATPVDLQLAALGAVAKLGAKEDAAQLLERWEGYGPATRRALVAACLGKSTWRAALLDAAAVNPLILNSLGVSDRNRILNDASEQERARVEKWFAQNSETSVNSKLAELSAKASGLRGDPRKGKDLFAAQCSICHQLDGVGRHVGPDLTALTDRTLEAMVTAIVDPNAAVEDKYVSYLVTTGTGETMLGSIASESSTTITLKLTDGSERSLLRKDLESMVSTGNSLMPEGFIETLQVQQLADLIAFVQSARPSPKEFPGNEPQEIVADTDGNLDLSASKAYVYGPSIRFSTRYRQLENWRDEKDEVVWQVNVPESGIYAIKVDASCDSGVKENAYVLIAGEEKFVSKVNLTRSENDFRVNEVGEIKLSSGNQEILMRPNGKIKSSLHDLRRVILSRKK